MDCSGARYVVLGCCLDVGGRVCHGWWLQEVKKLGAIAIVLVVAKQNSELGIVAEMLRDNEKFIEQ